jgi:CHAT domain
VKKQVILFLAANPRTSNPLRLAEECADIQRELKMSPHRDDFHFESRWAVSIDELMRHLNELAPTVIHFAGHGAGKPARSAAGTQRDIMVPGATTGADGGGIYLQDEQGQPQLVSPRALAMMIKAAGNSARVVVLNACYTAAQADVLRDKVECIVGMDGAIDDDAARAFAMRFYGALGNRRSVGNAVDQGIAALAAKQMPDEMLPRCMTRDGVDGYKVLLDPL